MRNYNNMPVILNLNFFFPLLKKEKSVKKLLHVCLCIYISRLGKCLWCPLQGNRIVLCGGRRSSFIFESADYSMLLSDQLLHLRWLYCRKLLLFLLYCYSTGFCEKCQKGMEVLCSLSGKIKIIKKLYTSTMFKD